MTDLGGVDLATVAARFGARLHAAGVAATPERCGRFAAAIDLAAPSSLDELYWLGRVTLVPAHRDIESYDRVFAAVFRGLVDPAEWRGNRAPPVTAARRPPPPPTAAAPPVHPGAPDDSGLAVPDAAAEGDQPDRPDRGRLLATTSEEERLRSRDLGTLDEAELATLRMLARRLALAPPPRRSRRMSPAASGSELDLRATLRQARRTGGDPVRVVSRRHRSRRRRLVLLCDISGSMDAYARAYLTLLLSAAGGAGAEAFVFATRLTRLTPVLRATSPQLAVDRAGRRALDWSGGTRIGEALKAFNDDHGRRGLARGAVVVILSDGWERNDPALVAREMARLARLAFRIIWVNPRRAQPGFQPATAGMAAALPYTDHFLSGHSLEAFDEVLEAISDRSGRRRAIRAG